MLRSNLFSLNKPDFEKCERCRKSPATIDCSECGPSSRPMKFCYECDKSYHQMYEKQNHAPQRTHSPLRQRPEEVRIKSPLRFQIQEDYKKLAPHAQTTTSLAHTQFSTSLLNSSYLPKEQQSLLSPKSIQKDYDLEVSIYNKDTQLTKSALRRDNQQQQSLINLQNVPLEQAEPRYQRNQPLRSSFSQRQSTQQEYKPNQSIHQVISPYKASQVTFQPIQSHLQSHVQSHAQLLSSPPPEKQHQQSYQQQSSHNELSSYYQKMAEDYREKFLEIEKDYNYLKQQNQYELEKMRNVVTEELNAKREQEIEESDKTLRNKELIIHQLQVELNEMHVRAERESSELVNLQRLQTNLELDYKQAYRDFETQMKERDGAYEKLKESHGKELNQHNVNHKQEIEKLKKEHQEELDKLKSELETANKMLNTKVEQQDIEIKDLTQQLNETSEKHKEEKSVLQETLSRDQYNIEIRQKENEQLRQAKMDFEDERNRIYTEFRHLEQENDRFFHENKELRKKVKKLEHILYGRGGK